MTNFSNPTDQYWATLLDHSQLLDALDEREKNYFEDLRATGLMYIYERAYRAYYGGRVTANVLGLPLFESSKLVPGGKQGQKTRLKSNHHRNLLRHLHQLVTSQKLNIQTRAANTDSKSQTQTILGNGLLEYYWKEKDVGNIIHDAAEIALAIYAEAFIHTPWDLNAGRIVSKDLNGRPIYEGDQKYEIFTPLEVIRDPSHDKAKKVDWYIVKMKANRWELINEYPNLAEDIKNVSAVTMNTEMLPNFQIRGGREPINHDLIEKKIFYHKKSSAIPQGRMVVFVKDTVLFDGPIPYRNMPVKRLCPEELNGTIYGYTVAWDMLGLQDAIDELHTILMSNNKTFGMQFVQSKSKVQVSTVSEGMKALKSDDLIEPVQLTKSAPETYNYLNQLKEEQELISGISATVRGNPEANLKSGNALALVVSQSIQFASGLDESINRVTEEVGLDLFYNIQDFSTVERIASITGKSNISYAKTFKAEDIDQINRVVVEQTNPLSQTIAGRTEMANNMLQQGLIKDPEDYIQALATGNVNIINDTKQIERIAIQAMLEALRDGQPMPPMITDNHPLFIDHLKSVISSPIDRTDPTLVTNTTNLINQHLQLWRSMDPALLMVLNIPAPPPLPAPPMPPQQQQSPQPQHPPVNNGAPISHPPMPVNPVQQQASGTHMPTLPSLPPNAPPETQAAYEKMTGKGAA